MSHPLVSNQTSILPSRWKLLWTLSRPNSTLDFSLNWGFAARKVEQLDLQLHLDWKPVVELPHCSTTLAVLKLSGNFELNLPSYYICYTLSIPNPNEIGGYSTFLLH
ncbi:hypothetical protein CMV_029733 [Castanea mollissima]|uniref:Uncharacterized protein n=1 Tax=Castanea mollissima TaxID=60419 RepID=A0A8J4Q6E9_9ROSI|nr:hypothetical protein CMV_029733 [Castanea mollissima]